MMKSTLQNTLDIRLEELVTEQATVAGATLNGAMGDEAKLVDLGLDSLGFVTIIVEMQRTFGVDPFGRADEITYPETLGQLKALYRAQALSSSPSPAHGKES